MREHREQPREGAAMRHGVSVSEGAEMEMTGSDTFEGQGAAGAAHPGPGSSAARKRTVGVGFAQLCARELKQSRGALSKCSCL